MFLRTLQTSCKSASRSCSDGGGGGGGGGQSCAFGLGGGEYARDQIGLQVNHIHWTCGSVYRGW